MFRNKYTPFFHGIFTVKKHNVPLDVIRACVTFYNNYLLGQL